MSRRGCSLPANASSFDPHRASISSRFGQVAKDALAFVVSVVDGQNRARVEQALATITRSYNLRVRSIRTGTSALTEIYIRF